MHGEGHAAGDDERADQPAADRDERESRLPLDGVRDHAVGGCRACRDPLLRHDLPRGSLVGGAAAENYDLEQVLASRTPVVFGMLAALGFILLLIGSVRTSGRVVVSAAAVMIAVFLTFALSGPLAPKEMGVILAVAVALDALVVRLVLIPALLALTRHAAWHQPRWLARILPKVRFSH